MGKLNNSFLFPGNPESAHTYRHQDYVRQRQRPLWQVYRFDKGSFLYTVHVLVITSKTICCWNLSERHIIIKILNTKPFPPFCFVMTVLLYLYAVTNDTTLGFKVIKVINLCFISLILLLSRNLYFKRLLANFTRVSFCSSVWRCGTHRAHIPFSVLAFGSKLYAYFPRIYQLS